MASIAKKVLIVLVLILICLQTFAFAVDDPDYFDPAKNPLEAKDIKKTAKIANKVLKYIRYIGIVLAVIVLSVIGLRILLGSAEEKAKYMDYLRPFMIGCVLLVSATFIPQMISGMTQRNVRATGGQTQVELAKSDFEAIIMDYVGANKIKVEYDYETVVEWENEEYGPIKREFKRKIPDSGRYTISKSYVTSHCEELINKAKTEMSESDFNKYKQSLEACKSGSYTMEKDGEKISIRYN